MIPGVRRKKPPQIEFPVLLKMAAPYCPKLVLVAEAERVERGGQAESRLLRRVRGSKMAAAEEDCAVSAEADRELEELLESKSP